MLDGLMRRIIDPVVNRWGRRLAARGWGADSLTLIGFGLGMAAAAAISLGVAPAVALVPLLAGRLADGLDGAVARATTKTDFGGYLDIVCDFAFYGAIPLAFVLRDPGANGVAGGFMILSFYVNGTTFLAYAILAEKRQMETTAQGEKSLYYSVSLLGGTETIACFVALCLWPEHFATIGWIYGTLCFASALLRVLQARGMFRAPG